jgi:hypothetical protein
LKTRTFLASLAVAVVATLPLAGVASAQPADRDCPDFATQADAQAALDSRAGDPERLDANDDGVACESYFDEAAAPAPAPDEEEDSTAAAEPTPTSAAPTRTTAPRSTGQISVIPQGAVDTGDGTSRDDGTVPLLLVLGGGAALGVAALRRHAVHQR